MSTSGFKRFTDTRGKRGDITDAGVAAAREAIVDEVRAYRLAELRKDAGLSQTEVADRSGVSQRRVSQIEHGALTSTEVGTLERYAEAIGGHLEVTVRVGDDIRVLAD